MILLNIILGIILWNLFISSITYKYKLKKNKLYCGIVAYSGLEPFNKQNIDTLMYINSIERGVDATGIYSNLNDLQKDIVAGYEYVTTKIDIIPDTMFMGHVRSKTVGINSIVNAHPFKRDNCILIHNGTLKNHWDLLRKHDLSHAEYSVDSDIIAGCLNKTDNFSVLSEINGAAAIVFHDIRIKNRLYVFKNKERPLYKGFIGDNMYISSIEETLTLIQCVDIKEFENDKLYTIEDGKIIGEPVIIASNPYKHIYVTNPTSDYELKKVIGCNVRMKYSGEVKINDITRKYFKHDYYTILGIVDNEYYTIMMANTAVPLKVSKKSLIMTDMLKEEDYVISICDLGYGVTPVVTGGHVTTPKGTILKVTNNYSDGTFGAVLNGKDNKNIWKRYFKKLYPGCKELTKFLKINEETEMQQAPFDLTQAIEHSINNGTPLFQKQIGFPNSTNQSPMNIIGNNDNFLTEKRRKLEGSTQFIEDSLVEYFVNADKFISSALVRVNDLDYTGAARNLISLETITGDLYNTLFTPEDAPTGINTAN